MIAGSALESPASVYQGLTIQLEQEDCGNRSVCGADGDFHRQINNAETSLMAYRQTPRDTLKGKE